MRASRGLVDICIELKRLTRRPMVILLTTVPDQDHTAGTIYQEVNYQFVKTFNEYDFVRSYQFFSMEWIKKCVILFPLPPLRYDIIFHYIYFKVNVWMVLKTIGHVWVIDRQHAINILTILYSWFVIPDAIKLVMNADQEYSHFA